MTLPDPDDDTFEKLLDAIRRQPDDQTARGILADRLHELGEYELEELWRGGAEKWLRECAVKVTHQWDDPPRRVGDSLTYEELLEEAADWITAGYRSPDGEDTYAAWEEPYRFSQYQLTTGEDLLEDPATAGMFWRALEIVWGKRIPEAAKECGGRMFNCGSCGV